MKRARTLNSIVRRNAEKKLVTLFDFKDQVCKTLMTKYGVPLRPAELAVIDMKGPVLLGMKEKKTPETVADQLISDVRRMYKVR